MRVRTLREHGNAYPPQAVKTHGRVYDIPDDAAAALIEAGIVEDADKKSKKE